MTETTDFLPRGDDDRPEAKALLASIKAGLPALEALLETCRSHPYEDGVYRFYHQSFKVFCLQELTRAIVERLRSLAPDRPLDEWFTKIVAEGTGKSFSPEDNRDWPAAARPIVEAFFHARYFLEMAVRHGCELEAPPCLMPSGWAALLCLYGLR